MDFTNNQNTAQTRIDYDNSMDITDDADTEVKVESTKIRHYNSASGLSSDDLRKEIRSIKRNDSMNEIEKNKRVQELMTTSWRRSRDISSNASIASGVSEVGSVKSDKNSSDYRTYHNKEEGIYGCQHYMRGCLMKAPCCNRCFPCRFCHDEQTDHAIDRYAVEEIKCQQCGTEQPVSNQCTKCKYVFAKYFCKPCKFFDNHPDKQIYHCPYCNICRIGQGLDIDYFHCHRCNACMSITLQDHKCVERSLESNCPVCHEFMFTSTTPVMFLPCGHCMHVNCYEKYTATNYVCPICCKSLGNMDTYFARIDEMLESEQMPDEFKNVKSKIFCADCEKRSITSFHFLYHKCQDCGSYNTKVLQQLNSDEADPQVAAVVNTSTVPSSSSALEVEEKQCPEEMDE